MAIQDIVTLSKWGDSLSIRIPKKILDANNWKAGDSFEIKAKNSEIRLRKIYRLKKYDLKELFKGMNEFDSKDLVDWGEDVGNEQIILTN